MSPNGESQAGALARAAPTAAPVGQSAARSAADAGMSAGSSAAAATALDAGTPARRATRLNLILLLAILAAAALSIVAGKVWLPWSAWTLEDPRWLIIAELRIPRTVLGFAVGAALGLAGAAMQGYLRNPLADPGLFGISSGAALGATISLYFGFATSALLLPTFALFGAAGSMLFLAILAGRSGSLILFALAGMILQTITASLTA